LKFLCNTEFIHSGGRAFFSGTVYSDITAAEAEKLIAADKKKPLGALSFFTPVDEEAVDFIKTLKSNGGRIEKADDSKTSDAGRKGPGKYMTRAELITMAKNMGIKGADRMSVDELKEVINARAGENQQQTTEPPVEQPAEVPPPLSA
jgi:hypothetical protein